MSKVISLVVPDEEREKAAFALVAVRRTSQAKEHGMVNVPAEHWLRLIMEELGETAYALNQGESHIRIIEELQDVGALAVAAIASLWRQADEAGGKTT